MTELGDRVPERASLGKTWVTMVLVGLGIIACLALLLIYGKTLRQTIDRSMLRAAGIDDSSIDDLLDLQNEVNRPAPKAGVRFGQTLAWRELYRFKASQHFVENAVLGQFDHDPELELLLMPTESNSIVLDSDASATQHGLSLPMAVSCLRPWDYNNDGIDELVPSANLADYLHSGKAAPPVASETPNLSLYTPVLNLQGQINAKLYGRYGVLLWRRAKDGPIELVLYDDLGQAGRKLIIYKPGGEKNGVVILGPEWYGKAIVDFDMDGVDDILLNDYYRGVRSDWKRLNYDLTISDVPELRGEDLWGTADVNGDGRIDYFTCYDTWLDAATGEKTILQLPPGAPAISLEDCIVSENAVGSYFNTSSRQVAFYYGPGFRTTSLVIFEATGTCLHYEEMGEDCDSILTWQFNGQDHLVLCTASRVLIYP